MTVRHIIQSEMKPVSHIIRCIIPLLVLAALFDSLAGQAVQPRRDDSVCAKNKNIPDIVLYKKCGVIFFSGHRKISSKNWYRFGPLAVQKYPMLRMV